MINRIVPMNLLSCTMFVHASEFGRSNTTTRLGHGNFGESVESSATVPRVFRCQRQKDNSGARRLANRLVPYRSA